MQLSAKFLSRPKSLDTLFPWILAMLAVGYVALHWSNPLAELLGDGHTYLNFAPFRTAGYPVFLDLVEVAFGSVNAVPKIQLVIAATAFAFLGWSLYRAFRSTLFALSPVVVLMLHPQVSYWHSHIMTESIFISLLCGLVGFIIVTAHHPTWRWTAAAALACGLAIMVRPAGISLLIIWPFLLWFLWRRCDGKRIALAAAVIVPIAFCLIAETLIWHGYHESESRPSLADRHLFAKAMLIESAPVLSDPELARLVALGRGMAAPARVMIANAPNSYARTNLLYRFEARAQYWDEFYPEIDAVAGQRGTNRYEVFAQVGRPTMLRAPLAWIGNALTHYLGIWPRAFVTPVAYEELQAYLENADPNPLEPSGFSRSADPVSPMQRTSSRLMALGLTLSTLAMGLAMWQRLRRKDVDVRLAIAAVCCLAIHAHLLTTGLFGIIATRYAVAMAPLLGVCGVLLASWVIEQVRGLAARRFPALAAPSAGGGGSE